MAWFTFQKRSHCLFRKLAVNSDIETEIGQVITQKYYSTGNNLCLEDIYNCFGHSTEYY